MEILPQHSLENLHKHSHYKIRINSRYHFKFAEEKLRFGVQHITSCDNKTSEADDELIKNRFWSHI